MGFLNIFFITDPQTVQLWRFEDPVLGPRKLPDFEESTKGKILIPTDSVFKVNMIEKQVEVVSGSKTFDVGTYLSYLVV